MRPAADAGLHLVTPGHGDLERRIEPHSKSESFDRMTALEEMAASALVDSADVCEVLALVRASAEALADMDPV